jgi:hypothetical protein
MSNTNSTADTVGAQVNQSKVQVGRFKASSSVLDALRSAANQSGAKFDLLLSNAAIESGLNPSAKASTSSASGLFQFIDQTWLAAVKKNGAAHGLAAQAAAIVQRGGSYTVEDPAMKQEILNLRNDPKVAASLAADHLRDLGNTLTASLGHAPDVAETYLGHFLGAGGATQMLKAAQMNPNMPASSVLPEAARANGALFNNQTVGQFINKIRNRIDKTFGELGLPIPQGGMQFGTPQPASTEAGAQPGDLQPDGWGKGSPTKLATSQERIMLASLAEVFTRMGHHHSGKSAHNGGNMSTAASQALGSPSHSMNL